MRKLIKNGFLIDVKTGIEGIMDILIEDNIVKNIGANMEEPTCEVFDVQGQYVLPGLVDMHCHLRDPGFEYKEDIESGTKSAAIGGFTSIACMPNTNPVIDNESVIKYIVSKAKSDGVVNVYPIGAITKGLRGEELAEMGELKFAGAVAVSDDGNPVSNPGIMKKALMYAAMFDMTVISHCEEKSLVEDGVMNEGFESTSLGLKGIPSAAEEIMIARDLILAEYTKVPIHIAHVSTSYGVELIRNAKKRGVQVTCETCPHYFVLTDEAVRGYNTNAKVNPPLRTKKDVEAVIEGLKDGTIDVIATDHAPHHIDEKRCEFDKAANGMVGFETALPLAITYLVKPGHITLKELVHKMSKNPSRILGLNKGSIEIGKPADITIVDINQKFIVEADKFCSKSKNSPFDGFELFGVVKYTMVNGEFVVMDGVLL